MPTGYHAGGSKGRFESSILRKPYRFSTSSGNPDLIGPGLSKPLFAQHNKA